jgi:acyl-coenzyme A thioesterase PaaI-like protein
LPRVGTEADILTVEFKTTLLAPARGERFVFKAEVNKPGRILTFCEAKAVADHEGKTTLIATMTGTLMAMLPRVAASHEPRAPCV